MIQKIKQFFKNIFKPIWVKTGNTDVIFADLDFRGIKRIEVEEYVSLITKKTEWRKVDKGKKA